MEKAWKGLREGRKPGEKEEKKRSGRKRRRRKRRGGIKRRGRRRKKGQEMRGWSPVNGHGVGWNRWWGVKVGLEGGWGKRKGAEKEFLVCLSEPGRGTCLPCGRLKFPAPGQGSLQAGVGSHRR